MRKFKKRYYEELKRASAHDGCDPEVSYNTAKPSDDGDVLVLLFL